MRLENVLLVAVLFLLLLGLNYYYNFHHEEAHARISEYHGCVGYEISYDVFGGEFRCNRYSEGRTQEQHFKEMELHALHEIKGYNNKAFFQLFLIIGLLVVGKLLWKNEK